MKKSILMSAIIGALFLMTSCLGEISNSYENEIAIVYLDVDDMGAIYGKTFPLNSNSMRYIVSNDMIISDTFKLMMYSWDEDNGTKLLNIGGQSFQADLVRLADESLDIDTKILRYIPLPEEAEPNSFLELTPFLMSNSAKDIGDKWLFQYSYEITKGLTPNVEFFKRNSVEGSENVVIDVHMSHSGNADGATVEQKSSFVALNMSGLRNEYSNTNIEKLNIKFVYHLKGKAEPVESTTYNMLLNVN